MLSIDMEHYTGSHKYLFQCLVFGLTEKTLPHPFSHEAKAILQCYCGGTQYEAHLKVDPTLWVINLGYEACKSNMKPFWVKTDSH